MAVKDEIVRLKSAVGALSTATGYSRNAYLYHGYSADSSQDAAYRMGFVEKAEQEFLRGNEKEILRRAAELARNELREVAQEIIGCI
jgi:ribosomal protein S14